MQEKTEKPTKKKLRDARKRGEVAKSAHLTSTLTFGCVLLALLLGLPHFWRWLGDLLALIGIAAASRDASERFLATAQSMIDGFFWISVMVLGVTAVAAAAAVLLQVRGVFSLHPITPRFDRMNPGQNLRNLFSGKQLFELAKAVVEISLLGGVLLLVFKGQMPEILRVMRTDVNTAAVLAATVLGALFFAAFVVSLLTSAVDFGFQQFQFLKKQRMSRQELRYEHKDVEGDPLIRSHRRRFHRQLLAAPLRQQVERASVVVTNPTHFAVAVRYVQGETDVPLVVAKGVDDMAAQIRQLAQAMQVPIVRSPELARRLFATTDVEDGVPEEFFEALAAILVAVKRVGARAV